MKKEVKNIVFIIISIIVFISYLFIKEGKNNIVKVFENINYTYFVYALINIILMVILDGIMLHIIRKLYQKDGKLLNSIWIKTSSVFFGLITPLQIGNVAAEITLLKKNNMNTGDAATIILGKTIFIILGSFILYTYFMLTQFTSYNLNLVLKIIVYIGYY